MQIWSNLYTPSQRIPTNAMPYCGQDAAIDYLNFSTSPEAPVKAVACGFVQGGAGIPPTALSLLVFGPLGLALAWRIQHPGPIVVVGILTAGIAAASAPAAGLNLFGLMLFFGIAALGIYLYARAQNSL